MSTHEPPDDRRTRAEPTLARGVVQDLSGTWFAAPVDDELRRTGADPELDHQGWATVAVPGHWSQHAGLADAPGPLVYRHRFVTDQAQPDQRYWVRFDGVMSGAEVWLDGSYLGDTVGYFAPHRFEMTDQVSARDEHLLAVDVACPPGGGPHATDRANVAVTGSLQTGALSPGGNPGGIWRPVLMTATGPVAIRHSRLLCTEANAERGVLQVRVVVDSVDSADVIINTTVSRGGTMAAESTSNHSLASGENRLEWDVVVENPELWWPAALGDQPLYDVTVSIEWDGRESDRRHWQTGLRHVSMSNFVWRINGERLFTKAIAYGPSGPFLNAVDAERLVADVELAAEAGFDMMRIFAHVARPEIYQAADRRGMLLWQDLPMLGGYSSKVRKAAKSIVREAVDLLGAHPSVVAWGGHVLPNGDAVEIPSATIEERPVAVAKRFIQHVAPTWNRAVLDSIIGRELKGADGSRPVIARSGSLPSPSEPAGSDSFLWLGWRTGLATDLSDIARRWPRLVAFPGGIGTQSVVPDEWPLDAPTWPSAERGAFDRYVPRRAYGDGPTWAQATRAYQADVLDAQIQVLRRLKYRPTGGFCLFALADAEPSGGFGVVDFERHPKPAWHRVVDACRPVIVVADALPPTVVAGQLVAIAIHVVSDLRRPIDEAMVTARIHHGRSGDPTTGVGGIEPSVVAGRWRNHVAADTCEKVADLTFEVPATLGTLIIDIDFEAETEQGSILATNRYRTVVIPEAESTTVSRR